MMVSKRLGLLLLVALLVSCASPKQRFDRGAAAELRGDYATAIREYATLLRKKPDWPKTEERLVEVGAAYWAEADAEVRARATAGDFAGAAEAGMDAERVMGYFHKTALSSPMPASFGVRVSDLAGKGVRQLVIRAQDYVTEGKWQAAESELRRADRLAGRAGDKERVGAAWTELYVARGESAAAAKDWERADGFLQKAGKYPDGGGALASRKLALETRVARAQVDVAVATAQSAFDGGEWRRAHAAADKAERQAELAGMNARRDAMGSLKRDALRRGRRVVAVLPFGIGPEEQVRMASDWLGRMERRAHLTRWQRPPSVFIETVSQETVTGTMRRLGHRRTPSQAQEVARLAHALGADYLVFGVVESITPSRGEAREKPVKTQTAGGKPVIWHKKTYAAKLDARMRLAIYDARSGRFRDGGSFGCAASANVTVGEYDGDWQELRLSSSDRHLFGSDANTWQMAKVEAELAEQVIGETADRAFESVLSLIP
jgi:tetratricopeptide (TPR) repeat protein